MFLKEDFVSGIIFEKNYISKENRDLISKYVVLVERVDITIMY